MHRIALLVLSCTVGLVVGQPVYACGIDGIPSLSIDGRLVALSSPLTSSAKVDSWTPFLARGRYAVGHTLHFQENREQVAQTLPPVAFRYLWRWNFGDGTQARGMDVHHRYRHAGTYIITVEAYFVAGRHQEWFSFDKATIHIT